MTEPSLVRGAETPPLLEITIGAALDEAVERFGNELALVSAHQGARLSWRELAGRAEAFAAGLIELGLRPGDRVGIWAPNCAEWVITQFAAAKAGFILVTINPAYRRHELEYTLKKVGVRALVAAESFKSSNYAGMVEALAPEARSAAPGQLRAAALPELRALIKIGAGARPGWLEFGEVERAPGDAALAQVRAAGSRLSPGEPINIQFTSGTTGSPKGATLSHRNILNNGYFVGRAIGLKRGDRLCAPVPLYHCFGMVMANLACLVHGAAVVFPAAAFDAVATLRAVEDERCAALYGVPTMFIAILDALEKRAWDVSSLRTGIMAGAPCPIEVMKAVIEKLGMDEVTIAYGMTETSPVSFQTGPDDPIERRVSTVGRVQPHLEVKIVGADGAIVPRGAPGELCTRGYAVMLGYWEDPERTADVIDAEGWMHTGDLGTLDAEGYGNIVGRIKDMVIRGGENLFPREIEEFLFTHPGIAEAQVVGLPDPRYGEELCAWIRLKAGETLSENELRAWCAERIARHKIPRHLRFVDAFPMTVTGKVQKFLIREQMIAELGLTLAKTA
ncbi:MAG TPA: AMP-binding protein [Caulobacteraceae bacterium]|nr:AMP-binding protein [Caulobacteraceae bacterium]